jgi:hypothetical protein
MAVRRKWCPIARSFCKQGRILLSGLGNFTTNDADDNVDKSDVTDAARVRCIFWDNADTYCTLRHLP